jgi:hypothetical protein
VTTSTLPTTRLRVPARSALPVLAGAVLAAVLLWFAAAVLGGVDVRVTTGTDEIPVGLGAVVAAATVGGVLGWGLLALLARGGRRGVRIWRAVAVVVLALSLGGPLSSGMGTAAVAVLVALHVAVAAVLVPLLPRAVRP